MSSKVAILGGSFNPIHNGHIQIAVKAYEQFDIDEILVMPNKTTYYKKTTTVSDFDREMMVRLAIKPYHFMTYSDLEIRRGGVTYTYDTIKELHEIYGLSETEDVMNENNEFTRIAFIIGGDSLAYLDKWYMAEELFKMVHFLCAIRDEVDEEEALLLIDKYKKVFPFAMIDLIKCDNYDISSTHIRELALKGEYETIKNNDYLNNDVLNYIISKDLYKNVNND